MKFLREYAILLVGILCLGLGLLMTLTDYLQGGPVWSPDSPSNQAINSMWGREKPKHYKDLRGDTHEYKETY